MTLKTTLNQIDENEITPSRPLVIYSDGDITCENGMIPWSIKDAKAECERLGLLDKECSTEKSEHEVVIVYKA